MMRVLHGVSALLDPPLPESVLHAAAGQVRRVLRRSLIPASVPHAASQLCALRSVGRVAFDRSLALYATFREDDSRANDPYYPPLALSQLETIWVESWNPTLESLQVTDRAVCTPSPASLMFQKQYVVLVTSSSLSSARAEKMLTLVKDRGGEGAVLQPSSAGITTLSRRDVGRRTLSVVASAANIARAAVTYPRGSFMVCKPDWISHSIRDRSLKSARAYMYSDDVSPPTAPRVFEAECAIDATTPPKLVMRRSPMQGWTLTPAPKRPRSALESPCLSLTAPMAGSGALTAKPRCVAGGYFEAGIIPISSELGMPVTISRWPRSINRASFACVSDPSISETTSDMPNNALVCKLLDVLVSGYEVRYSLYKRAQDNFRVTGFRAASNTIRKLNFDLISVDDVDKFRDNPRIGPGIATRLIEILKTGNLQEATHLENSAEYKPIKELCDVWGIGPSKAVSLIGQGIRSVADLRKRSAEESSLLDRQQKIGLKHYDDLLLRIPRDEVKLIEDHVRSHVATIRCASNVGVQVAGSYLRGKESCGDVDLMIFGDRLIVECVLPEVVRMMSEESVLTDHLVARMRPDLPHRRLDLFAVPTGEYPFALLCFTGSARFNRSMRLLANKLGFTLSHKSIRRVVRWGNGAFAGKTDVGPPIECKTERAIFDLLGMEYKTPQERDMCA
jgi:DNA polymerase/3'-5' exonuclease PolX